MGHDISGFKSSDKEQSNEIAYLRRNAFSDLKHTIYNALDCMECSGGVSGNGSEKEFTKSELEAGLLAIPDEEKYAPERNFLDQCISQADDEPILIAFH
jgi:hypothetical protein